MRTSDSRSPPSSTGRVSRRPPLAELHLHLYGCIQSGDFLEYVKTLEVDWASYERRYESDYGVVPPIRSILERCRAGERQAEADFHSLFTFGDADAGNFKRFGAKMGLSGNGSRLREFVLTGEGFGSAVEEVRHFVRRIISTQRAQGIQYAEHRIALGPDFPHHRAGDLLQEALAEFAEHETAESMTRLAVSLPRADPWPMWEVTRELALGPFGDFLTAIDFCNVEEGYPPKDKRSLFDEVRDFNRQHPERALAILYHVGESFEDKSLESAVRWVHEAAELGAHRLNYAIALGVNPDVYGEHQRTETIAERIDQIAYDLKHADGLRSHGVPIDAETLERELDEIRGLPVEQQLTLSYDNPRLDEVKGRQRHAMEHIRSLGAVVEVCPTSNRRIGGLKEPFHHPVQQFISNGVPFVVSTDDPGVFDTTLADEIDWVIRAADLGPCSFDEIAERSWSYRSEVLVGREST